MTRQEAFPSAILLAAQHAERQTGCPACVTLAQWAQESGYGEASPGNNPFGMKWHSASPYGRQLLHTKEWVNGSYVNVQDWFIKFDSLEQAFEAHGKYLMDPQGWPEYVAAQAVWRQSRDWKRFIELMGKRYATDPDYAAELIALVERWELADFNLPA